MSSFNQNRNQNMQNQLVNVTTNPLPSPNYGKFSKYLGVSRILNKEEFIATAYDSGIKSRQPQTIYLGTFKKEEDAARAYDLVSLKLTGPSARLNFPIKDYTKALDKMTKMTLADLVSHIRRASTALGKSRFRGVLRNEETGKWQIRTMEAGKECITGAYETEEEAAVAFDIACIREKGYQAITNYNLRCYDVRSIFGTNKMQQLAIDAVKMRQKAVEMQAINGMKIWQQAKELEAINARKIQQRTMDKQASRRRLEVQQQQSEVPEPEDDPLRLTLATGYMNPKKPIACHRSLGCERQETEGLRNYFTSWALETARKELASSSNNFFNHGDFSPFRSYTETEVSRERPKLCFPHWMEGMRLGHGSSSVLNHDKNDTDKKGKAKVIYDAEN